MLFAPLVVSAALAIAAPKKSAKTPTPTPAPEKGSAVPHASGGEVKWASSFDEAVEMAKKIPDGRIIIDFFEPRCGECIRLDALITPSTSFFALAHDKVPVKVDRSTPEGLKLAQRLGVRAVPAWVIVTPDLMLCGIQIGTTNQGGWIETFVHSEASWSDYKKKLQKEAAEPDNEDLVFDIAQETFKRGGDKLAEPRFRKLATSAKKSDVRDESLAYLASIELDAGRIDEAAKDLDSLLATGTSPGLKERAELRRADVDIARGRNDLAARRLAAFKKEHPTSPLVKDADAVLAALKQRGFTAEN
jgi:predicted negative regulator of RcsB-dependent stress response